MHSYWVGTLINPFPGNGEKILWLNLDSTPWSITVSLSFILSQFVLSWLPCGCLSFDCEMNPLMITYSYACCKTDSPFFLLTERSSGTFVSQSIFSLLFSELGDPFSQWIFQWFEALSLKNVVFSWISENQPITAQNYLFFNTLQKVASCGCTIISWVFPISFHRAIVLKVSYTTFQVVMGTLLPNILPQHDMGRQISSLLCVLITYDYPSMTTELMQYRLVFLHLFNYNCALLQVTDIITVVRVCLLLIFSRLLHLSV